MIIWPLRALSGWPFTSMLTSSSAMAVRISGRSRDAVSDHAAALVFDHVFEFVAEVLDGALHGPRRRVAERADRVAFDAVRDIDDEVQVLHAPFACEDSLHHAVHPARAFPAGRALATGFGFVEARDALEHLHHAGRLVHHDDRRGTDRRADLPERVVVHVRFHHHRARNDRHGEPARYAGLHLPATLHAAGEREQLPERDAKRHFEIAGPCDVARNGKDQRATGILRAEPREPCRTLAQDRRHRRVALRVVDGGRLAVQTGGRREWRLEAGLAGLALERFEEAHFLAADIRASAYETVQIEVDTRALDALAEESGLVGFLERGFEARDGFAQELAANVVVANARAHRVAADRHALDDRVRVVAQDVAVVAGAGLALVRIADDVLVARSITRHEAPLHAGRKARAAPAAQAGGLHRVHHLHARRLLPQDLLPRVVTADRPVGGKRP